MTPDRWRDWCELLDAIEFGNRVEPRQRAWFLIAAREWTLAAGDRPLTDFLQITRRQRQAYLVARQRTLLMRLAVLLDPPGSAWHRAELLAEHVRDYYRTAWPAHRDLSEPAPGWSALTRTLFELWRLPLKPPTTARALHPILKATPPPTSVDRTEAPLSNADQQAETEPGAETMPKPMRQFFADLDARRDAMQARSEAMQAERAATFAARRGPKRENRAPTTQPDIEATARAEFARDAVLRDEFCGDVESYVAFRRAEARGAVRRG